METAHMARPAPKGLQTVARPASATACKNPVWSSLALTGAVPPQLRASDETAITDPDPGKDAEHKAAGSIDNTVVNGCAFLAQKCWSPGEELTLSQAHEACGKADSHPPCTGLTPKADGPLRGALAYNLAAVARQISISASILPENAPVNAQVRSFTDNDYWKDYPNALIIVPGFTPLQTAVAVQMHPNEKTRLERAKRDWDRGLAPFIFVSGGAVYPKGTPCYEGVEMKAELIQMGVPSDRVIVDIAAQHSTSNIRNAGRYMLDLLPANLTALIATSGAQVFYFKHPWISTFHHRSKKELGNRVGKLRGIPFTKHTRYVPSAGVKEAGEDPLDFLRNACSSGRRRRAVSHGMLAVRGATWRAARMERPLSGRGRHDAAGRTDTSSQSSGSAHQGERLASNTSGNWLMYRRLIASKPSKYLAFCALRRANRGVSRRRV
ncbi:MAG: YdcF family protein [Nannocystis sp.]|nr:YdcF family protein [Nannocystis sp.]